MSNTELAELYDPQVLNKIAYADQFSLRGKSLEDKKKIREAWLNDLLYRHYNLPETDKTNAVFFRSLVRDDYKGLFHAVIDASGIRDRVVIEDYQRRLKPQILNIAASRFMNDHAGLFDVLDIDDPVDRSLCFIRLCKYGLILDHLRRIEFKALICFADMQPIEHLLAWYFRKRGVATITLQHGLYVDYGDMETVNVINYLHQPSEYFLSWGPDTSRLIAQHHPTTKTVNCGKPLIFTADPISERADKRPYIAVFLDQKIFNAQNEKMLEIVLAYARTSDRAVTVRFHPSIFKKPFFDKFPEIQEQLHFTDAEFVVGHTTSLIYEALTLGCRVLRYESDIPGIPLPSDSTFRSLTELLACLSLPQQEDLSERYFSATGEASRARYTSFFRETFPDLVDDRALAG